MEIKNEYSKSDFGIVPDDWELKTFEDVLTGFTSGATPYRGKSEFYKGDIRWITSGELNYNNITDTKEKITPDAVKKTNLKVHPVGTFLIAITGLEAEGTRGRCGFVGKPSATNQSCMALFPIKGKLDSKYLYHYYIWQGKNLAFKYCQGTKQQSYTASIAKILPIICPQIREQEAIAEVLSDIDNITHTLERQIAKKTLIKQGTMQNLLTPKEGWEAKHLGEIATLVMGQSPSSEFYNSEGIGLPLIQGNADIEKRKTICRIHTSMITKIGKMGDIIMSVRAPVGEISKAMFNCCLGRGVCSIRYRNDYLYHYLIYLEKSWAKFSTGSTFDSVNSKQIREFEISIPKDESYQIKVSAILNDLDYEIELSEKKLLKYKLLKQGIMQNLFTGKIRLT